MRTPIRLSQRGQSLVEFAAISVPLVLLILGIMEFGRAFYAYSTIVNAASEGARYGILDPNNKDCIRLIVQHYSTLVTIANPNTDISITYPSGAPGFDKPIKVSVDYNFSAVTPLVPDLTFNGTSTMSIVHVPSSLGTCPVP